MEIFHVLVLDLNPGYAQSLKRALEQRSGDAEFQVFHAPDEGAMNDVRVNYDVDAYVISEEWTASYGRVSAGKAAVFQLLEDPSESTGAESEVYRSDAPGAAVRLIQALSGSTLIVAVTGVCGGSGVTTAAMALARYFAGRQKRTFYLSLEPTMASAPFSEHAGCGLAEVLVALDEPEGLEEVIQDACGSWAAAPGIEAFAISEYNADRAELHKGDVSRLLGAMRRMKQWDVIVVDLESRMDDGLYEAWEQASSVVVMIPYTRIGWEKLGYVKRELAFRAKRGEVDTAKAVPVLNFCAQDRVQQLREQRVSFTFPDDKRAVRHMVIDVTPQGAWQMSTAKWRDWLGTENGLQLFRGLCEEVDR